MVGEGNMGSGRNGYSRRRRRPNRHRWTACRGPIWPRFRRRRHIYRRPDGRARPSPRRCRRRPDNADWHIGRPSRRRPGPAAAPPSPRPESVICRSTSQSAPRRAASMEGASPTFQQRMAGQGGIPHRRHARLDPGAVAFVDDQFAQGLLGDQDTAVLGIGAQDVMHQHGIDHRPEKWRRGRPLHSSAHRPRPRPWRWPSCAGF